MFRNSEVLRFALLFLILAAILITVGFVMDPSAGIIALGSSAGFGTVFFFFTRARYRNLARISKRIDQMLHSADQLELSGFDEGELSILQSEITKMTLRIREQNDALKKDKRYLADSLADIAHQLRTPLTSANLILSFLAKNPDERERKTFVRELEGLLMQMDWLITSLLKLSRLDAGVVAFQSECVNVGTLMASALKPLAIPMDLRNIDVRITVPEDSTIRGDAGWLAEAAQNILKNCMENAEEHGKIEIICTDNALFTEITIRDNGAGFDNEDLPRLFDRFYRGKNASAAGYGIGLALCKMIVSEQGGTVTAKNHPQGGAVFALRFPRG